MSIERILKTPDLVDEIARRLPSPTRGATETAPILTADKLRTAAEQARAGRESKLSRAQEAIIRREGRPVFLVRNDRIDGTPSSFWEARLQNARPLLEAALPAVGRIDLRNHPKPWVGTGWLVAPDVVVTNRHVAREFVSGSAGSFVFHVDPLGERAEASVDFLREHESSSRRVFQVVRVIHVEDGGARPDVAFLKVEAVGVDGVRQAPPIKLAETDPGEGAVVGAVGYPAADPYRNAPEVMETLFGGLYQVKRFLPGEILGDERRYLTHDCSTLGGNSGSVVLDFATGRAVGLHFAGYYEDRNFAVKASTLAEVLHSLKIIDGGTTPVASQAPARRIEGVTGSAMERIVGTEGVESTAARAGAGSLTAEQTRELIRLVGTAQNRILDAEELSDLGVALDDEVAARLQSWLHDNAAERARVQNLDGEIKFDERDLRWGLSLLNWLRGLRKHAQKRPPNAQPEPLPSVARIAIAGDWGSGLYGAPQVGKSIGEGGYQLAVHLGDVYYAGTEKEVRDNFLKYWPHKVPGLTNRALNSNHEMYSGGYGYFDLILPAFGQTSSYFATGNDHFVVVGLDTGYEDHDLDDEQTRWLEEVVGGAGARKVILMSHHQLFDPGKPPREKLARRLGTLLDAGKIFAWYWGHEHAAIIYDPHPRWRLHARCIGHGGFPYFRYKGNDPLEPGREGARWRRLPAAGDTPAAMLLDDPNTYVRPADPERYGAQGFASLELAGSSLTERLHRPEGTVIYEKKLA